MAKEPETIWRLQEDDFYCVMEDEFPSLTEEQMKKIIEIAHRKFEMYDWTEYVKTFIECYIEDVK